MILNFSSKTNGSRGRANLYEEPARVEIYVRISESELPNVNITCDVGLAISKGNICLRIHQAGIGDLQSQALL